MTIPYVNCWLEMRIHYEYFIFLFVITFITRLIRIEHNFVKALGMFDLTTNLKLYVYFANSLFPFN
jgi:hypothetical protein